MKRLVVLLLVLPFAAAAQTFPSRAVKLVTPYSTGTWGSRCAVMSGGAVATACKEIGERVKHIAAYLLGAPIAELALRDGEVGIERSDKRMTLAEVAHTWYRQPQLLPPDVHAGGLETTAGYKAQVDTGTFSYACHAVALAVDTELGNVELLDYVIAEDGGTIFFGASLRATYGLLDAVFAR